MRVPLPAETVDRVGAIEHARTQGQPKLRVGSALTERGLPSSTRGARRQMAGLRQAAGRGGR